MNLLTAAHTVLPLALFAAGVFFADNVRNFVKGIPGDIAAGADSVWDRVVADSKLAAARVVADAKARLAPTTVALPGTINIVAQVGSPLAEAAKVLEPVGPAPTA